MEGGLGAGLNTAFPKRLTKLRRMYFKLGYYIEKEALAGMGSSKMG